MKVLLGLFIMFSLVGSVLAAATDITLVTPAEGASLSGTAQMLNTTVESPLGDAGHYNVSFYYQVAGESTWTLITTVTNTSANQDNFNATWDTTGIVDKLNLTINATGRGYTNDINSTSATLLHPLDNGNPTASISSASFATNYQRTPTQTFTLGLSADATIGISSCTIFCTDAVNSSVYSTTTTTSGNACSNTTATSNNFPLPQARAYNCLVQATDGNTNSTNSSTRLMTIIVPETGGKAPGGGSSAGTSQSVLGGVSSGASSLGVGITSFFKSIWNFISFWN